MSRMGEGRKTEKMLFYKIMLSFTLVETTSIPFMIKLKRMKGLHFHTASYSSLVAGQAWYTAHYGEQEIPVAILSHRSKLEEHRPNAHPNTTGSRCYIKHNSQLRKVE